VIKYIGSKRRLVAVLGDIVTASGAKTAIDLFTGTTRVAQEFKRRGVQVTAVDRATYSHVLSQCYVETDAEGVDLEVLDDAIAELNALPGRSGYFTQTFCEEARYFQPKNGQRVDAIRDAIEESFRGTWLYPVLLTSLMEAADRVDSTTGVQMAYLKTWAPRSHKDLDMRRPVLIRGSGEAVLGEAQEEVHRLSQHDVAYLDPPYNQHRYFTNYHIWETLIRWDAPEAYGIARKRIDSRSPATKSRFNEKREMPAALCDVVRRVPADFIVLSYNNEAWIALEELVEVMSERGAVEVLAFDSKRYVGAQIGIHNPKGEKVGKVSHLRNLEYVILAGERATVDRVRNVVNGDVREKAAAVQGGARSR
jgi:adenine-specific DNA-methyltransferase